MIHEKIGEVHEGAYNGVEQNPAKYLTLLKEQAQPSVPFLPVPHLRSPRS